MPSMPKAAAEVIRLQGALTPRAELWSTPILTMTSSTRYEWLVNGVTTPETSNTLSRMTFAAGDKLTCIATFDDGLEGMTDSMSVTVLNAPPTVSGVALSESDPDANDELRCDYTVADADGDPILAEEVTWYINGQKVGNFVAGTSYLTTPARSAVMVRCTVGVKTKPASTPIFQPETVRLRRLWSVVVLPPVCSIRTKAICFASGSRPDFTSEPNASFVEIDVGQSFACGVTTDAQIECWGHQTEVSSGQSTPSTFYNDYGEHDNPRGLLRKSGLFPPTPVTRHATG